MNFKYSKSVMLDILILLIDIAAVFASFFLIGRYIAHVPADVRFFAVFAVYALSMCFLFAIYDMYQTVIGRISEMFIILVISSVISFCATLFVMLIFRYFSFGYTFLHLVMYAAEAACYRIKRHQQ